MIKIGRVTLTAAIAIFAMNSSRVEAGPCLKNGKLADAEFLAESSVVKRDGRYLLSIAIQNCSKDRVELWANSVPWLDAQHVMFFGYYAKSKRELGRISGIGMGPPDTVFVEPAETLSGEIPIVDMLPAGDQKDFSVGVVKEGVVYFWTYELRCYCDKKFRIGDWGFIDAQ